MRTKTTFCAFLVVLFSLMESTYAYAQTDPANDRSKLNLVVWCKGRASGERSTPVEVNTFSSRTVVGVLSNDIDLANNEMLAKQILNRAVTFAEEKCPLSLIGGDGKPISRTSAVVIDIRHGQPADLSEGSLKSLPWGAPDLQFIDEKFPKRALSGDSGWRAAEKTPEWQDSRNASGPSKYTNVDAQRSAQEARLAQQRAEEAAAAKAREQQQAAMAKAQELAIARQRQAEQDRQLAQQKEAAARTSRRNALASSFGVKAFPKYRDLSSNPFVFQSQVVAFPATFERMTSASQALFSADGAPFVPVDGVPTTKFTQSGTTVMLVVRVVVQSGKATLAWVGSSPCQQPGCLDYSAN